MKNETYETIIEGTNDLYYGFRADGITARINEFNKNSACLSYKNAVRSLREKWFSSSDWFIEIIRKLDYDNITLNTCGDIDDINGLWEEAIHDLEFEATSRISDILIEYLDDMLFMKMNTWIVPTIDERKLNKKNELIVDDKYLRLDYSTDKNRKATKEQFKALTKNLTIKKWVYQMDKEVKYHTNNEVLKSLHKIYDVNGAVSVNSLKINIIKEVMNHGVDDYIAIKLTNGKRQRLIDDKENKIDAKVQKAINEVCRKLYTLNYS